MLTHKTQWRAVESQDLCGSRAFAVGPVKVRSLASVRINRRVDPRAKGYEINISNHNKEIVTESCMTLSWSWSGRMNTPRLLIWRERVQASISYIYWRRSFAQYRSIDDNTVPVNNLTFSIVILTREQTVGLGKLFVRIPAAFPFGSNPSMSSRYRV